MLATLGAPHMTGDRLAFAAISSLYLVVAIPWEERSLTRSFADEYGRYKQQVKWRVIPFVIDATANGKRKPENAERQTSTVPASPFSMNTIECCDGMSNFFPHVLQVTESSTRIM